MRGEAKDGPRRAAHRDAAPDASSAARDPGAGAVDRKAERSGEVRAEEVEPRADAWGKAAHLAGSSDAAASYLPQGHSGFRSAELHAISDLRFRRAFV